MFSHSKMCQYAGGKARIGKQIYEAIRDHEMEVVGSHDTPYFEPFLGMGGVMTHFAKSRSRTCYATDVDECIVSFWRKIQTGWIPDPISREQYTNIKSAGIYDAEYAFAAYGCSFRGSRWTYFYKDCMDRAIRRIRKKNFSEVMKDVQFLDHSSYVSHDPSCMLIYCDPPYKESSFDKRRSNLTDFDTSVFWDRMRSWSEDNVVVVSERTAPKDFVSIFSLTRKNPFNGGEIVEHLFVHDNST